jgi:hypothetical protein
MRDAVRKIIFDGMMASIMANAVETNGEASEVFLDLNRRKERT